MSNTNPSPVDELARANHRRQLYWQILLPILFATLAFIALGVFAASAGTDRPAVWANISTIMIACILMFTGLGSLLFLAAGIMGVDWLIKKLSPFSYLVQLYVMYFGKKIRDLADQSTKPVVSIQSNASATKPVINRIKRNISRIMHRKEV